MRLFCIATILTALCLGGSQSAFAQDQLCGDRARVQQILDDCRETLAELKGINSANPNFKARQRAERQIKQLRRKLHMLRTELAMPAEPELEPAGPMAMSDAAFSSLLSSIDAESFGKGKLRLVSDAAAAGNYFTVQQLRTLMSKFKFSGEKIDTAATLHPRLVDPGNFFEVYQELTFEADKKRLKKRIGQ